MAMKTKRTSGFVITAPEIILGLATATVIGLMILSIFSRETETLPKAYDAWVKLTGNPKSLTYDEWRALVSSREELTNPK